MENTDDLDSFVSSLTKSEYAQKGFSKSLFIHEAKHIHTKEEDAFVNEVDVSTETQIAEASRDHAGGIDVDESSTSQRNYPALVYEFPIYEGHCFEATKRLGLGVVLSWFDEISTIGIANRDKQHRLGVSVTLEAFPCETFFTTEEISAGNSVHIISRATKIGRSLAFCDLELRSKKNVLLARGRHIKYLEMGQLWNVLTSPLLIGATRYLGETFLSRKTADTSSDELDTTMSINYEGCGKSRFESLYFGLQLELCDDDSDSKDVSKTKVIDNIVTINARLEVTPGLCNLFGNMHGGAVMCAVELMAKKSWNLVYGDDKDIDISYLTTRFLAPTFGTLDIQATFEKDSKTMDITFISSKKGNIVSQSTCFLKKN